MKHSHFLLILALTFFSIGFVQAQDNEELKSIYKADQSDRQTESIDWSVVGKRDKERRDRVSEILAEGGAKTGQDYKNAAMVFQHGGDSVSYKKAVDLMTKATQIDPDMNKWLLAAATDRYRLSIGQKQIYGTQFRKANRDAPWELSPIDTTVLTDADRAAMNAPPLAYARQRVIKMNKKSFGDMIKEGKTTAEIISYCKKTKPADSPYNIDENALNSFGYQLMGEGKTKDALKVFVLNTKLNPKGFNTFDSLGECLVKMGKKKKGVKMYKKSLELNPKNDNATNILKDLGY